jgi:flagellar biogenesis protein FliO
MDVASTLRQAGSILLVISLLGFAVWKLRRPGEALGWNWRGAAAKGREMQAVERLALTPQHSLHLVRMHGCEIVIATHPQGCTLLSEKSGGLHE